MGWNTHIKCDVRVDTVRSVLKRLDPSEGGDYIKDQLGGMLIEDALKSVEELDDEVQRLKERDGAREIDELNAKIDRAKSELERAVKMLDHSIRTCADNDRDIRDSVRLGLDILTDG